MLPVVHITLVAEVSSRQKYFVIATPKCFDVPAQKRAPLQSNFKSQYDFNKIF